MKTTKVKIIGLVILALFIGCLNKTKIDIEPKSRYFVYGEVSNLYTGIYVWDFVQNRLLKGEEYKASLFINGVNHVLKQSTDKAFDSLLLKPNSNFMLSIIVEQENLEYQGSLPDSSAAISLESKKIGEFSYSLTPIISELSSHTSSGFYFDYDKSSSLFSDERETFGKIYFTAADVIANTNEINYYYNTCTNPPAFDASYQYSCKIITSKFLAFLKYWDQHKINKDNPLYLAHAFDYDVHNGNSTFRIIEYTTIASNIVTFYDSSEVVLTVNLYDKNGLKLPEDTRKQCTVSILDSKNAVATYKPAGLKNPITFTRRDLASISKSRCEDAINIENIIGREISIWSAAFSGPASISDTKNVLIQRLDSTYQVSLRLKQQ